MYSSCEWMTTLKSAALWNHPISWKSTGCSIEDYQVERDFPSAPRDELWGYEDVKFTCSGLTIIHMPFL